LASGCNKPEAGREEEAAEVVQNHESGTCSVDGIHEAEATFARAFAGVDSEPERRWRGEQAARQ